MLIGRNGYFYLLNYLIKTRKLLFINKINQKNVPTHHRETSFNIQVEKCALLYHTHPYKREEGKSLQVFGISVCKTGMVEDIPVFLYLQPVVSLEKSCDHRCG